MKKIKSPTVHFTKLSFCLLLVFTLISCKKENDTVVTPAAPKISYLLSKEYASNSPYFTLDSVKIFQMKPDFSLIYNNLGVGLDRSVSDDMLTIFKPQVRLDSIVKYSINEQSTRRFVISWSNETQSKIVDSILKSTLQLGSKDICGIRRHPTKSPSPTLYVDLLSVKKLGTVQIDFDNTTLNKYLNYASSRYNNLSTEGINYSATQFDAMHGQEFCSAITLGVASWHQIQIITIDTTNVNKDSIIIESMDILNKVFNEQTTWSECIKNSKYLKNTQFFHERIAGWPGANVSALQAPSLLNKNDETVYKQAQFGVLSQSYLPYSTLYPKYNFLQK